MRYTVYLRLIFFFLSFLGILIEKEKKKKPDLVVCVLVKFLFMLLFFRDTIYFSNMNHMIGLYLTIVRFIKFE